MVGAGLLTTRAASNPLANAWDGVDDQLIAFGERISRFLPAGGALRPIGGVQFGEVARIADTWFTDPGIAFTATIPGHRGQAQVAGRDVRHVRRGRVGPDEAHDVRGRARRVDPRGPARGSR